MTKALPDIHCIFTSSFFCCPNGLFATAPLSSQYFTCFTITSLNLQLGGQLSVKACIQLCMSKKLLHLPFQISSFQKC